MSMPRGGQRLGDGLSDSVAGSVSSSTVQGRRQAQLNGAGWFCSLLGRRIGRFMPAPAWYNNPACGAVGPNGTQRNLECGLFAVNHCLASKRDVVLHIDKFRERAGNGAYSDGDFDDEGLQRNLNAVGCDFSSMRGAEYEHAVRDVFDDGSLAIFNGQQALGCVVHMPVPRHWIAFVAPPEDQKSKDFAAILCDSLFPHVFALSVDEVVDFFLEMGLRHNLLGESKLLTNAEKQILATEWCAYQVSQ